MFSKEKNGVSVDHEQSKKEKVRLKDEMHWGNEDELVPLHSLDPDKINNFDELLTAMSQTAFGGRNLGEALDVLETMVVDPDCVVVGTFSGAMTVAKMGSLICTMLDNGWLDIIVSTGALMAHGFIESIGLKHFKYEQGQMDDKALFNVGYNRIYDTLEPELNLCQAEEVLHNVLSEMQGMEFMSSESLCKAIGKYLDENFSESGILKSAYKQDVPVYIPAFTDSELALDIANFLLSTQNEFIHKELAPSFLPFQFNPFLDLFSYTRRIINAKHIGIFTIGGGVPRNWAQQVAPFLENMKAGHIDATLPVRRFMYGVRICPEPVHWGGLSGCTYQEGISWGKFVPPQEGGRFAEVLCDATIAWPLLIKGLQDRLEQKPENNHE